MTRRCCIVGCKSNTNKKFNYINTFSFPRDPAKREVWIKAINRKGFVPDNRSFVCIKHFEQEDLVRKASKFKSGNGGYVVKKVRFQLLNDDVSPKFFPHVSEDVSYVTTEYKPRKADCTTTVQRSSSKRKAALKCSETWRRLYNLKKKTDDDVHYSISSCNESISDCSTDGQDFFTSRVLKNVSHHIDEDYTEASSDQRPVNMHFHKKFGLVKYYTSDNASSGIRQDASNEDSGENSATNVNLSSSDNTTGSASSHESEDDSSNNIPESRMIGELDEHSITSVARSSSDADGAVDTSSNLSHVLQVCLERIDDSPMTTASNKRKSSSSYREVKSSLASEDCHRTEKMEIDEETRQLSPLCPKMKFIRNLNLRKKEKSDDEEAAADIDTITCSPSKKRFSAMRSVFTWRQLLNIHPKITDNTSKRSPSKKSLKSYSPQKKSGITCRS